MLTKLNRFIPKSILMLAVVGSFAWSAPDVRCEMRARISRRAHVNAARVQAPKPKLHPTLTNREKLEQAVEREAARHKLDPQLLWALIAQESNGYAGATSKKGAQGVMQLMPETARRWGVRDPRNVDEAVRGATEYLVWLIDKYNGDVALGLAGYNAGEGAVDKYGKRIPPYRETQNYVRLIAARYEQLKTFNRSKQANVGESKSSSLPDIRKEQTIATVKSSLTAEPKTSVRPLLIRLHTSSDAQQ